MVAPPSGAQTAKRYQKRDTPPNPLPVKPVVKPVQNGVQGMHGKMNTPPDNPPPQTKRVNPPQKSTAGIGVSLSKDVTKSVEPKEAKEVKEPEIPKPEETIPVCNTDLSMLTGKGLEEKVEGERQRSPELKSGPRGTGSRGTTRIATPQKEGRAKTPPDGEQFISTGGSASPTDSFSLARLAVTPPEPTTPSMDQNSSMRTKARTPPTGVSGEWWEKIDAVRKATKRAKGATIDEKLKACRKQKRQSSMELSSSSHNPVVDLMTSLDSNIREAEEYTEEDYQYAEWIGIDLNKYPQLIGIAREGLRAPIPEPWSAVAGPQGEVMYYNSHTKESTEEHPLDSYFRLKYESVVKNEEFMSVEEYILQVIRPADVNSEPIIITNTSVQFTDVTTKYVIKMVASPEGIRYTVSGAERPSVKKVVFDTKTKMMKFPDLKKGATLPKNCPEKLIAAIKRLCELSSVAHNFPSHLTFTPAQEARRERPLDRGATPASPPMHPVERRVRKARRKEVQSPDTTLYSAQSSMAQMQTLETHTSSSSSLLTGQASGPQTHSVQGVQGERANPDDELFRECLRRVEANSISRNEFLQPGNFSDKEVDELLLELKFTVMQRYRIKARLDTLRMEHVATVKNAELDRQLVQAQQAPVQEEDDEEEEELTQEEIENSDLLERLGPSAVPEEYICTITGEILRDPQCTCDGHVYEKSAIVSWLFSHDTSPNTNKALDNKSLIPNIALRKAIQSWRDAELAKVKAAE